MPSPFPGMDPFLERPSMWLSAHTLLIAGLIRALNRTLPSTYFARPNERVYVVDEEDRRIYSDSIVIRDPGEVQTENGATSTAIADPPLLLVPTPEEVIETFVEVIRADGNERIVTTIEILSPRNKTKGHKGRTKYLQKQQELLASKSHLIEIDLLRNGPHTVAAPASWLNQHRPWHYVVSLHRGAGNGRFEAWVASIRNRLPRIHVPLDPGDPPTILDLQAVLAECYADGRFEQQINYSRPLPPPPFIQADQEWIEELLRTRKS